jgi:hypothetical protein
LVAHVYSDLAAQTTLSTGISDSSTSITVNSVSGFPGSFPYYLVIDRSTASREVVEVTNAVGTVLDVVRGESTTVALSHSAGAVVEHCAPSEFYTDAESRGEASVAHIAASSGVHGVVGDVVGDTDSQTLENKTIVVENNTISTENTAPFAQVAQFNASSGLLAPGALLPAGDVLTDTSTDTVSNKTILSAANTFDASIDSIGGLTPAADSVPYYTGASTAALATFTTLGRSIVSRSSPVDVRNDINAQTAYANLDDIGVLTSGLIASTGGGSAAGRTLTGPAAGITVTNGNGVAGNPTLALADDLAALEGLGSTGIAARTAANTWAQRTITSSDGSITVSNGNGVSGNPDLAVFDDGWTAAGFTIQTGWTNVDCRYRVIANHIVYLHIEVERTGADIVAPASGNIGNNSVVDIPTVIDPDYEIRPYYSCSSDDQGGQGRISTAGLVQIVGYTPSGTIATGATIKIDIVYFT